MTTNECTKYIKNYLHNNKTLGALMLTSSWGRGKSYYIDWELVNGEMGLGIERCIKVSLYGLKTLNDISKAIYIELWNIRTRNFFKPKNEISTAALLAGRTILRGLLSYNKISLGSQSDTTQKLFNMANLSDKLIILEDVERSSIPIVEIMGYVNNLCEQDNLKVLLVANENEIINNKETIDEYYRIKEKTISDTISFECPIDEPINNILSIFMSEKGQKDNNSRKTKKGNAVDVSYENYKNYFLLCKNVLVTKGKDIIKKIMQNDEQKHKNNGYNFRSLIYALQKTEDFFRLIDQNNIEIPQDILQDLFQECLYSIIAFSLQLKRGDWSSLDSLKWENDLTSPIKYGHIEYPLRKEYFDFIVFQNFNILRYEKTVNQYKRIKEKDHAWKIINYEYSHVSYDELICAVKVFQEFLINGSYDIMPLENYYQLAQELFVVQDSLAKIHEVEEISTLLHLIIEKLSTVDFCPYEIYSKIEQYRDPTLGKEMQQKYNKYKERSLLIVKEKAVDELTKFIENNDDIKEFYNTICKYEAWAFGLLKSIRSDIISKCDVKTLSKRLANSTQADVEQFIKVFETLYHDVDVKEIIGDERIRIMDFIEYIEMEVKSHDIDIILKYQLVRLLECLKNM